MNRAHSYAQIPVAEAGSSATGSGAGPSNSNSNTPANIKNNGKGYAPVRHNDNDEDEDEEDEEDIFMELQDESSHMLRPMSAGSSSSSSSSSRRHPMDSEITVAPPLVGGSRGSSTMYPPPQHHTQDQSRPLPAWTKRGGLGVRWGAKLGAKLGWGRGSGGDGAEGPRRLVQTQMDGVFSNLSAKPRVEKPFVEELPPPYKSAAMDVSPAYYETTVMSPYGEDEVLVDGLPVGGFLGFLWNMIISMSFQFVGFFLTYLLHTSHSTKEGSKAGLGITFISMGTQMMRGEEPGQGKIEDADTGYSGHLNTPSPIRSMAEYLWLSYMLCFLGVVIVLHAVFVYTRALKMEQIINATSSETLPMTNPTLTTGGREEETVPASQAAGASASAAAGSSHPFSAGNVSIV